MKVSEYIDSLLGRGIYTFTSEEARDTLQRSAIATRAAIRRFKEKGLIVSPVRGFHVVVPPEYRSLGSLPPEQFVPQLMSHLGEGYYVALLSAAQFHGAAHQQPQTFQVMVSSNRKTIRCGRVKVEFVAKKNLEAAPTQTMQTPRGPMLVSTPEMTAFDLVGYPHRAGGLNSIATVLDELGELLDADNLARLADTAPTAWSQRLGYLLFFLGYQDLAEGLTRYIQAHATVVAPLDSTQSMTEAPRANQWKLAVNTEVCPDL